MVFLPGWGFDGRIISLLPEAPRLFAPTGFLLPAALAGVLLDFLDERGIASVHLAGWSMGASLALIFALEHPGRIASLTLLSLRRAWPAEEVSAMRREFEKDLDAALRSFYRRSFLGAREAFDRFSAGLQETYLQEALAAPGHLREGLDFLEGFDAAALLVRAPDAWRELAGKTLLCHGGRDRIAPFADLPELPGARRNILPREGHALFLDRELLLPERKRVLRSRFSQAATTYDAYADVQQEASRQLAARCEAEAPPRRILELGCGTGSLTTVLSGRYPEASLVALDFAPEMLAEAAGKVGSRPGVQLVCADAEDFLAGCRGRFDWVVAGGVMQWFVGLWEAFGHIHRVLNDGGVLQGFLFGPETFAELEAAFREVLGYTRGTAASRFADADTVRSAAVGRFARVEVTERRCERRYASLRDLLTHLKRTGTTGWGGNPPLLTRARLARLDEWFRERHGGYRASYQLLFVRAEKGAE